MLAKATMLLDPNERRDLSARPRTLVVAFALAFAPALARADVAPEEVGTPFSNDRFGSSIACDGETLAISASGSNLDAFNGGAVYVYERSESEPEPWILSTVLGPPSPRAHAGFGDEIAVSGDLLLITEDLRRTADDGSSSRFADENRVHVYLKRDGEWRRSGELVADDPAYRDNFGGRLIIHGSTVLVGADATPRDGAEGAAVFEFSRDGDAFAQSAIIIPELEEPAEQVLTWRIAFDGETLMIPAWLALHTYRRAEAGWERTTRLDVQAVAVAVAGAQAVLEGSGTHVLDRQEDGSWIVGEPIPVADDVGWIRTVEIEGDTLFLGGGDRVPVYTRAGESAPWLPSGELEPDMISRYFGWPLVAVGDEVFVAAFEDDRNGYRAGAVLRFSEDDGAWEQSQVFVSVERPEGCGCRSTGPGQTSWGLLLLPLLGLFRRRRLA